MNRNNEINWCGVLLQSMENGNVADETLARENLNRLGFDVVRHRIVPTYRPFASMAEFAPHQDRWVISNKEARRRVVAYTDKEVGLGFASLQTFKEAFDRGCVFADDGSPFGVKQ